MIRLPAFRSGSQGQQQQQQKRTSNDSASMQIDEPAPAEIADDERRRRWRERGIRVMEQSGIGDLNGGKTGHRNTTNDTSHNSNNTNANASVAASHELVDSSHHLAAPHVQTNADDMRHSNKENEELAQVDNTNQGNNNNKVSDWSRDFSNSILQQPWSIDFSEIHLEKRVAFGGFAEVYKANWRGMLLP